MPMALLLMLVWISVNQMMRRPVMPAPEMPAGRSTRTPAFKWVNTALGLRLANPRDRGCTEAGVTRRSFRRTGFPSSVVSTAATNGVLLGAPRPRFPPERSPPR